ncbi:hypothetical protein FB567DRAFT_560817 [Paraphoma chrysanthemicola]|uniref:Uncharacterized protein n=1 Tax=Paraphoma chrysanthemicola TaxID=798071 RepID=A0A8K0VYE3_9PLEO|nr:hypothetical protein FB567DRAFT_560817 [Paraphoma chrysanthemicola]
MIGTAFLAKIVEHLGSGKIYKYPGKYNDTHALIIRAGITGLILAQAEKKDRIRCIISEREQSLNVRSNEGIMAIHWSLKRLETLLPTFPVPIDPGEHYPVIRGETGKMFVGVPYKRGLRVPRSKMRKLCVEDIARTGRGPACEEIALNSVEKVTTTSFSIWHMNLTVCYNDVDKARYVRSEFPTGFLALSEQFFHALQSISSMPDGPDHSESGISHLATAWCGVASHDLSYAECLAIIKEKAMEVAEPARSSFMWIPEGTQPRDNRQGRMTLVDNAAHLPPFITRDRGQGLNDYFTDVFDLVAKIKQVASAEKGALMPCGSEELKCSVENDIMLHGWEKVKQGPAFTNGARPVKGHDE